jgi:hypothetical protein
MDGMPKSKSPRIKKPMTIQKIFGLNSVKAHDYGQRSHVGPDPTLLYGVELEIERASFDWVVNGFNATEDGSLRHGGVEFISLPMTYSNLKYGLESFFNQIDLDSDNYSERTSIHVHTNCQDLLIPQLTSLLMLYQVFEELLFNWIGHEREQNIFCVPWSQTRLTHNVLANIENFVNMSSVERNKYTALNLVPLRTLGTVEWRHMYGHNDVPELLTWLRIIGHMFRVARNHEHSEVVDKCVNLNSTSQYEQLLDFVFQDDAIHIRSPNYRLMLENGVLNMKYSLQSKDNKAVKTKAPNIVTDNWFIADDPVPVQVPSPPEVDMERIRQEIRLNAARERVQNALRRTAEEQLQANRAVEGARAEAVIMDDIRATDTAPIRNNMIFTTPPGVAGYGPTYAEYGRNNPINHPEGEF